jgi:hypothetical protein
VDARTSVPATGGRPLTQPPGAGNPPLFPGLEGDEGLEEEISTLRVRVRTLLTDDDTDVRIAVRAMDTLVRSVIAQHRLSPRSNKDLFARYAAMLAAFERQLADPPPE